MSKKPWNVGDRVQLASGGPSMTVVEVENDEVLCQRFDEKHQVQTSRFPAAAVREPASVNIPIRRA